MNSAIFIFGRTPRLSFLELTSFYPDATRITEHIARVGQPVDAPKLMQTLGGSVKIAEVIAESDTFSTSALVPIIANETSGKRVTFGVSTYGNVRVSPGALSEIKKALESRGLSARYVETKANEALSSVVVAKQQLVEAVVVEHDGTYMFARTLAVQDFEEWNRRDFGRPAIDPKAGMLPPKVARMIVNIALAGTQLTEHPMLLDPFCGMGTVLSEALLRGANVTGSDVSQNAVEGTKKNLAWLRSIYPEVASLYAKVERSDATHISTFITRESIDAIATEPFMGENVDLKNVSKLTPERVKNVLKGLENLYIGSLKEWAPLIKSGGRVVMAMPAYATGRTVTRVKRTVDRCESLGYTLLTEPIEYSRPQAVVRREFYIFRKVKS